jgi:hypothetical protein
MSYLLIALVAFCGGAYVAFRYDVAVAKLAVKLGF